MSLVISSHPCSCCPETFRGAMHFTTYACRKSSSALCIVCYPTSLFFMFLSTACTISDLTAEGCYGIPSPLMFNFMYRVRTHRGQCCRGSSITLGLQGGKGHQGSPSLFSDVGFTDPKFSKKDACLVSSWKLPLKAVLQLPKAVCSIIVKVFSWDLI